MTASIEIDGQYYSYHGRPFSSAFARVKINRSMPEFLGGSLSKEHWTRFCNDVDNGPLLLLTLVKWFSLVVYFGVPLSFVLVLVLPPERHGLWALLLVVLVFYSLLVKPCISGCIFHWIFGRASGIHSGSTTNIKLSFQAKKKMLEGGKNRDFYCNGVLRCTGCFHDVTCPVARGHVFHIEVDQNRLEDPMAGETLGVEDGAYTAPLPEYRATHGKGGRHPWVSLRLPPKWTVLYSGGELRVQWKDQGWGNRKGALWARVPGDGGKGTEWARISKENAAHSWRVDTLPLPGDWFDNRDGAAIGSTLELACVIGGGGGHRLFIHPGACLVLKLRPPPKDDEIELGLTEPEEEIEVSGCGAGDEETSDVPTASAKRVEEEIELNGENSGDAPIVLPNASEGHGNVEEEIVVDGEN